MLTRTVLFATALALPTADGLTTATTSDAATSPEATPASMSGSLERPEGEYLPTDRLYFTTVDVDALMRAAVIDPQDQVVGSVAELMVSGTGQITDAVVRLSGGPLGVSGERVVISFDELKVENIGQQGFANYRVHTVDSETQLASLPRFEG